MKSDYANFADIQPVVADRESVAVSLAESLALFRALYERRQELIREAELIRQALKGWVN